MNTLISSETEARLLEGAQSRGLSVDSYLRELLDQEQREFTLAVEQGLREVEEGRVRPARAALAEIGQKLGFSR